MKILNGKFSRGMNDETVFMTGDCEFGGHKCDLSVAANVTFDEIYSEPGDYEHPPHTESEMIVQVTDIAIYIKELNRYLPHGMLSQAEIDDDIEKYYKENFVP